MENIREDWQKDLKIITHLNEIAENIRDCIKNGENIARIKIHKNYNAVGLQYNIDELVKTKTKLIIALQPHINEKNFDGEYVEATNIIYIYVAIPSNIFLDCARKHLRNVQEWSKLISFWVGQNYWLNVYPTLVHELQHWYDTKISKMKSPNYYFYHDDKSNLSADEKYSKYQLQPAEFNAHYQAFLASLIQRFKHDLPNWNYKKQYVGETFNEFIKTIQTYMNTQKDEFLVKHYWFWTNCMNNPVYKRKLLKRLYGYYIDLIKSVVGERVIREDWQKDKQIREVLNQYASNIISAIQSGDCKEKILHYKWKKDVLLTTIEYNVPEVEKYGPVRFMICVVPDKYKASTIGAYKRELNTIMVYMTIRSGLYDIYKQREQTMAKPWAKLITNTFVGGDIDGILQSTLIHELEHWYDYMVEKYDFSAYAGYPQSKKFSPEKDAEYRLQPIEYNANYQSFISDLQGLIRQYKKLDPAKANDRLNTLFGSNFSNFAKGVDTIMNIKPVSPMMYYTDWWNALKINPKYRKKFLKRLYGWYINEFKNIVSEQTIKEAPVPAFHGTHQSFRKFRTYYIGNGEGTQVYGWGFYFTDNKPLAAEYANYSHEINVSGWKCRDGQHISARVNENSFYIQIGDDFYTLTNDKLFGDANISKELVNLDKAKWSAKEFKLSLLRFLSFPWQIQHTKISQTLSPSKSMPKSDEMRRNLIVAISNLDILDRRPPLIYEVILWPDKEPNLIAVGGQVTPAQKQQILQGLRDKNIKISDQDIKKLSSPLPAADLYGLIWRILNPNQFYDFLYSDKVKDKKVSMFFLSAGIDGAIIPGDYLGGGAHPEANNYLVFDSTQIKVVKKEPVKESTIRESPVPAFHGSPNKFKDFDAYYMGAGEGAQAFGWGFYFTTNVDVAKDYAVKLGTFRKYDLIFNNVSLFSQSNWNEKISQYCMSKYGQISGSNEMDIYAATQVFISQLEQELADTNVKNLNTALKNTQEIIHFMELAESIDGDYEPILKYVDNLEKMFRNKDIIVKRYKHNVRNLYEVVLWPNKEPDLIQWNGPLTPQQINKIQEQMKRENLSFRLFESGENANETIIYSPFNSSYTKGNEFNTLGENTGQRLFMSLETSFLEHKISEPQNMHEYVSLFLLRSGIDGIKYPTGITNGYEGQIGWNYVVFDQKEIKIVKRDAITERAIKESPVPAFHGSPHKFNKFNCIYLGKGEGFQIYGWGLYFTTNEEIARNYYAKDAGRRYENKWFVKGKLNQQIEIYFPGHWEHEGGYRHVNFMRINIGKTVIYSKEFNHYVNGEFLGDHWVPPSLKKAMDDLRNSVEPWQVKQTLNDILWDNNWTLDSNKYTKEDLIQLVSNLDIRRYNPPVLYHVVLWPNKEPNLLNWTSPVTPEQWQAILSQPEMSTKKAKAQMNRVKIGKGVYDTLSNLFGQSDRAASEMLLRAGIDGIVYPVEASTGGKGEKGLNYVVFDQKDIKMVRKETVKESTIKESPIPAFHGTIYNFKSFDCYYMGKGEGQDAFGWGFYFTDNKKKAEKYYGKRIANWHKWTWLTTNNSDKVEIWWNKQGWNGLFISVNDATVICSKEKSIPTSLGKIIQSFRNAANPQDAKTAFQLIAQSNLWTADEWNQSWSKEKLIEYANSVTFAPKAKPYIYEVTLWPNKTPDLIDVEKPLTDSQKDKIIRRYNVEFPKNQPLDSQWFDGYGKQSLGEYDWYKNDKYTTLYDFLAQAFGGSRKDASLFLSRAGIDGVIQPSSQMYGGKDKDKGSNYIVFDQKEIQIIKKETISESLLREDPVPAFHGTPYHFKQFKTFYMGRGEGAHLCGWGLYFTSNYDIAKDYYAKNVGRKKGFWNTVDNKKVAVNVGTFPGMYRRDWLEITIGDKIYTSNPIDNLPPQFWGEWLQDFQGQDTDPNKAKQAILNIVSLDWTVKDVRSTGTKEELIQLINNIQFKPPKPSALYEVILWPNKEPNLLRWVESLTIQQLNIIINKLKEKNIVYAYGTAKQVNDIISKEQTTPTIEQWIKSGNATWQDLILVTKELAIFNLNDRDISWGRNLTNRIPDASMIYMPLLVPIFKDYKSASLFLLECGFDGIIYPAEMLSGGRGETGWNYVVFDEKEVKIIKKEKVFLDK